MSFFWKEKKNATINMIEQKYCREIYKRKKYKVTEDKYIFQNSENKDYRLSPPTKLRGMVKELNSVGLTDCSNKIRKECTNR